MGETSKSGQTQLPRWLDKLVTSRVKVRVADVDFAVHTTAFIVAPLLILHDCLEMQEGHVAFNVGRLPVSALKLRDLFCSMAVHEAAHAMACRFVGAPIKEMGIAPIGAYVRFDPDQLNTRQKIVVYLAGPAASAVMALMSWRSIGKAKNNKDSAVLANRTILNARGAIDNLVPVPITDGGRVLDELLGSVIPDLRMRIFVETLAATLAIGYLWETKLYDKLESAVFSQCAYPPID